MIAASHGRPLRFLCVVTGGWIAMRVALLWPTIDSVPALIRAVIPAAQARARSNPARLALRPERPPTHLRPTPAPSLAAHIRHGSSVAAVRVALASVRSSGFGTQVADPPPVLPGVPRPFLPAPARSRWSGSAWFVARPGDGIAAGVVGGQLGGSQTGVRIAYALGLEWQPTRLPLRIVAEERVALDDAKTAPTIGVVGGVGPLALGHGIRLEAYGQAGVVGRTRTEPYADGAARAAHPLAGIGQSKLAAGAGVWAAAQRGASRVDIGPALTIDVPLARQPVRFALEYRARVAGDARPGSGVALSLGTDF